MTDARNALVMLRHGFHLSDGMLELVESALDRGDLNQAAADVGALIDGAGRQLGLLVLLEQNLGR